MCQERLSTCFTVLLLTSAYRQCFDGNTEPPCGPWKIEKWPRFCSTLRGSLFGLQWKALLSSASHLLRHEAKPVTEGAFAQRYALCQRAPERLRCVVMRKENNSFKTEGEVTIRRESSFFSCWRQMGWLRKCFHVLEKLIFLFLFLTEEDVLKQL